MQQDKPDSKWRLPGEKSPKPCCIKYNGRHNHREHCRATFQVVEEGRRDNEALRSKPLLVSRLPGQRNWEKEALGGRHGRQEPLGAHQGLGHDVHQDFVALPVAKEGSTLVLHQRGRRAPHQVGAASRHCLQRLKPGYGTARQVWGQPWGKLGN